MPFRLYLPELERAKAAREASLASVKEESMSRMMKDLAVDRAKNPNAAKLDRWDPNAEEEEDDEDYEVGLIDRRDGKPRCPIHCPQQAHTDAASVSVADEGWPGQYSSIVDSKRQEDEGTVWPRPQ